MDTRQKVSTPSWVKYALVGAIVIALIPSFLVRCTRVDSSAVGVRFNKLSLTEQGTLDASPVTGYVFYCPITTDVFKYPTYVQRVDYKPFTVTTRDAAIFTMDPTMAYYLNRAKFENEVRLMLDSALTAEGFIVTEFTSQITPPESLRKMIDAKNAAVQAALKAENEVKEAEANAKIAVAKAEGEAKAMKIKADAEAYYNRTISAALSKLIIQEDWIEKWDGKLPQVQGGDQMMPVVNFNSSKE